MYFLDLSHSSPFLSSPSLFALVFSFSPFTLLSLLFFSATIGASHTVLYSPDPLKIARDRFSLSYGFP